MVNSSTTQLLPIPINTSMDSALTSGLSDSPGTGVDTSSFAALLSLASSPGSQDGTGQQPVASRRTAAADNSSNSEPSDQSADVTEVQSDSATHSQAAAKPSSDDVAPTDDDTSRPPHKNGRRPVNTPDLTAAASLLAAISGHPSPQAQLQPAPVTAMANQTASAVSAGTSALAIAEASPALSGATPPALTTTPNPTDGSISSRLPGQPMDSHATAATATASGMGNATNPSPVAPAVTVASSVVPVPTTPPADLAAMAALQGLNAGKLTATATAAPSPTPTIPANTNATLPSATATNTATKTDTNTSPILPIYTNATPLAPVTPLHQAQTGQAASPFSIPPVVASPAAGNGVATQPTAAAPADTARFTPSAPIAPASPPPSAQQPASTPATAVVAANPQPAAITTAANRLNGIDRLLTLSGTTTRAVATVQAGPVSAAGQAVPPGDLQQNAATPPQLQLTTLTAPAAPAATASKSAGTGAAVPTPSAPAGPITPQAARSIITGSQAADATPTLTTAQAFRLDAQLTETQAGNQPVTVDPTVALTSAADGGASATIAAQVLSAAPQTGRVVVLPHDDSELLPSAEAVTRAISGTQSSLTSSAVIGAQAGARANADTAGDDGNLPPSPSEEPDTVGAGLSAGATGPQAFANAGGSASVNSAAGAPVDHSQLIAQVTRNIETMRLRNGQGEMTVKLTPDQLGSVRLTITNHADGVTAHIVTETAQAQHAMQSGGQQLHAALEARGLKLTAFDVTVGQAAADAGASYGGPRDTPQERAARAGANQLNSGRSLSAVDEGGRDIASAAVIGRGASTLNGGSRLDYRA